MQQDVSHLSLYSVFGGIYDKVQGVFLQLKSNRKVHLDPCPLLKNEGDILIFVFFGNTSFPPKKKKLSYLLKFWPQNKF